MQRGPHATIDLAAMDDPARSEAEVERIVIGTDDKSHQVLTGWRFHESGADTEEPLHILLASYDFDFETDSGACGDGYDIEDPDELFEVEPQKARGVAGAATLTPVVDHVLHVFDAKGREVTPFDGDNFIDYGVVCDLNQDGILERADTYWMGWEDSKVSARVLSVRTFETKPRTLLKLVLYWDDHADETEEESWTFSWDDRDDDGVIELVVHPESRQGNEAVFRWDKNQNCFAAETTAGTPVQLVTNGTNLKELYKGRPRIAPIAKSDKESKTNAPSDDQPSAPFTYQSLRKASDEEIFAFFHGRPEADAPSFDSAPEGDDGEPIYDHLPDGFWDLDPKSAARAFAEANRTDQHRRTHQLAVDDRDGIAPPRSGWLVHDWHSDGSYTYTTHQFALRFGVEKPFLIHTARSRQGMVGANPLVDRPGYTIRILELTARESRFLVDTIFWLDRVRTRDLAGEDDAIGGTYSSADGSATLTLHEDGQPPRDVAQGTVWATSSIAGGWTGDFAPETCLNMVDYLLAVGWVKRLGERWKSIDPLTHRNLGTPIEERLKPRADADARELLATLCQEALDRHEDDPLPASLLLDLVSIAGDEGLVALREPLQALAASLPPLDDEDREFERLERKFAGNHFGPDLNGGNKKELEAWARLEELRAKRFHAHGPVLREALVYVLRQLDSLDRPDLLMAWARNREAGSSWALQRLERAFPEAHADILFEQFQDAEGQGRRMIFKTLAAARPGAALQLRDRMEKTAGKELLLEIVEVELEHDPDALSERIPALFQVAQTPDRERYWRRGSAMELLSETPLDANQRDRLNEILLAEFRQEHIDAQGEDSVLSASQLDTACKLLSRQPDGMRFWDLFLETSGRVTESRQFEALLDAILHLSKDDPERRRIGLETLLRNRLHHADGFVEDALLTILAYDVRGLDGLLSKLATRSPDVRDGSKTNHSTSGRTIRPVDDRYHAAREILALWAEDDPATRARLWIAFVINHSYPFENAGIPRRVALRERAAREIAALPQAQCTATVSRMLAQWPAGRWFPDSVRAWLLDPNA